MAGWGRACYAPLTWTIAMRGVARMATELIVTQRTPAAARRMADAANRFVDSLTPLQRSQATFPFEGDERYEWNYTPVPRNGLLLIDMTPAQQELALTL